MCSDVWGSRCNRTRRTFADKPIGSHDLGVAHDRRPGKLNPFERLIQRCVGRQLQFDLKLVTFLGGEKLLGE